MQRRQRENRLRMRRLYREPREALLPDHTFHFLAGKRELADPVFNCHLPERNRAYVRVFGEDQRLEICVVDLIHQPVVNDARVESRRMPLFFGGRFFHRAPSCIRPRRLLHSGVKKLFHSGVGFRAIPIPGNSHKTFSRPGRLYLRFFVLDDPGDRNAAAGQNNFLSLLGGDYEAR